MLDKNLTEKLENIKLFAMDVDGTLTDGGMYYSVGGEELKRFSTRDGMGITLLRKGGIKTLIITSEQSAIAKSRAEKLGIDTVILGSKNKSEDLFSVAKDLSIEMAQIAYIGDDVNDEQVMKLCGFSACPNDAVGIIKNTVNFVSNFNGGYGAVREICDLILVSQNKSINLNENW